jgi:hypothetical protein
VVPWWWWCSLRWPENDELGTHAGFGRRWDEIIIYGMMAAGWVSGCGYDALALPLLVLLRVVAFLNWPRFSTEPLCVPTFSTTS